MKAIRTIVATVGIVSVFELTSAATVMYSENFDTYTPGNDLPSPWVDEPSFPGAQIKASAAGWNGTVAGGDAGGAWTSSAAPTGYTGGPAILTLKARVAGGSRNLWGVGPTTQLDGNTRGFEMDGAAAQIKNVGTIDPGVTTPIVADTWYELRLTYDPQGGGSWDYTHSIRSWDGAVWSAWNQWDSGNFSNGTFAPDHVHLMHLYSGGGTVVDDISLVPEPASMVLWGIGGLLLMVRRRLRSA